MRPPELRLISDDEIIADLFAGGGGASLGIEMALGRSPDIAVNHDAYAIAMHKANHPNTEHWIEDVFDVDPTVVCRGRKVGLLWCSPDCTFFSRARNGQIRRDKRVRSLANVAIHWASTVRPRIIMLECVEELLTWGPLDEEGMIIKARKGEDFQTWWTRFERLGYHLEKRVLSACDFGAPTSRKRLFIIARCDGQPIPWAAPTHGPGRELPWRTAAECIDYSLPCPSIFMTKAEASHFTAETGIKCKRPLADKTMSRIRRGLYKYVLNCAKPFVIPVSHGDKRPGDHRVHSVDDPLRTVTGAHRGELALVQPFLTNYYGEVPGREQTRASPLDHPLPTQTTANRFGIVVPFTVPVKTWGGGGNEPREIDRPVRTITTSKRGEFAVVAPYLARIANGEVTKHGPNKGAKRRGSGADSLEQPMPTITASSITHAVIAPTLVQTGYGERPGQEPRCLDLQKPLGTIISGGNGGNGKHALVTAFLSMGFSAPDGVKYTGGDNGARPLDAPTGSITTRDHHNLVVGHMVKFRGTSDAHMESSSASPEEPVPTISANGNHVAEVRAFLSKWYGNGSPESLTEPLDTVTTKDRFGLVVVGGTTYQITDIGLRMLTPRELFTAQGFPRSYVIDPVVTRTFTIKRGRRAGQTRTITGPLTPTLQVAACGNSVPPPVVCALVRSVFMEATARRAA